MWKGIILMLIQISHLIVTVILEVVGKTRARHKGSSGRWPYSVGGRTKIVLESLWLSPPSRLWAFPRNPFSHLIPFLTSCPIFLSQSLIYRSRQSVEQSYFLSVYVSWLLICTGSLSREWLSPYGLQCQCPALMGTLPIIPCCWLVMTTDHSAISALLAIWGGLPPGSIQAPLHFRE